MFGPSKEELMLDIKILKEDIVALHCSLSCLQIRRDTALEQLQDELNAIKSFMDIEVVREAAIPAKLVAKSK